MKHRMIAIGLPFLFCLVACGDEQQQEPDLIQEGYALEEKNAGFAEGQQAPDFLPNELTQQQTNEAVFEDEQEQQAEAQVQPGKRIAILRLGWGQFPLNSELTQPTHWQGIVYAEGAKVFVKKAIYYERRDFFRPCIDRTCVKIDSVTLPHHDGLLLKVVPLPNAANPPRVFIHFEDLYSRVLDVSDLVTGISEVVTVDTMDNKVVLSAFVRKACPKGMLAGLWKRINLRGGIFAGHWLNEEGLQIGTLAGLWGLRKNGKRVFFGIYADTDGQFKGLIKGIYRPFAQVPGRVKGGAFLGRWVKSDGSLGGILRGHYADPPVAQVGVFRGRFKAQCAEAPIDEPDLDPECLESNAEVCEPLEEPCICDCTGLDHCVCGDRAQTEAVNPPLSCTCQDAPSTDQVVCSCEG